MRTANNRCHRVCVAIHKIDETSSLHSLCERAHVCVLRIIRAHAHEHTLARMPARTRMYETFHAGEISLCRTLSAPGLCISSSHTRSKKRKHREDSRRETFSRRSKRVCGGDGGSHERARGRRLERAERRRRRAQHFTAARPDCCGTDVIV